MGRREGPTNNVIQSGVSEVPALTPPTAETVPAKRINLSIAVATGMGLQRGVPRQRPTAIQSVSSSSRRPADEIGRAFSQAPDSLQDAANRRALSLSS